MAKDYLGYEKMVEEALRGVARTALRRVAEDGLPAGHHFYLSFRTGAPGVEIADHLRDRYPDEMTIVLQHKFWDLRVADDHFRVMLDFEKAPHELVVPFAALTGFADPFANFGLQFGKTAPAGAATGAAKAGDQSAAAAGDKVVAIETFRKK